MKGGAAEWREAAEQEPLHERRRFGELELVLVLGEYCCRVGEARAGAAPARVTHGVEELRGAQRRTGLPDGERGYVCGIVGTVKDTPRHVERLTRSHHALFA